MSNAETDARAIPHSRKAFIPIESNPALFTQLIHRLGVSTSLRFEDVLSVTDPELLALIPRPVLALVSVSPYTTKYKANQAEEEALRDDYTASGQDEKVMWFRQTIHNACGLYAILHAVSNGDARAKIRPESTLAKLLSTCEPLTPSQRPAVLEGSEELEAAYNEVALTGDSAVPESAEVVLPFHYQCFVKSEKTGRLYQLAGWCKGPVDRGLLDPGDDMLSTKALSVFNDFIHQEEGNPNFSLLALVPAKEN